MCLLTLASQLCKAAANNDFYMEIQKHWGKLLPDPDVLRDRRLRKKYATREAIANGTLPIQGGPVIDLDGEDSKSFQVIEIEDSDDEDQERKEFDAIMQSESNTMTLEGIESRIAFLKLLGVISCGI